MVVAPATFLNFIGVLGHLDQRESRPPGGECVDA